MKYFAFLIPVLAALITSPCFAQADGGQEAPSSQRTYPLFDEGKLLATAGVNQVEGAGGGGIVPWAMITGYGSKNGIGIDAHTTYVPLRSFSLHSAGAAIGLYDRVELSFAHQWFVTGNTGAALGLGRDFTFEENVVGTKVRLFGNIVYDQNDWLPETSVGLQYKVNDRGDILRAVGAKDSDGVDFYVATSKLWLQESVLVNATLRMTRANQFGILGFGGPKDDDYQPEFEGSVAYLFTKRFAVGGEFRTKPDNLGFAHEDNAYDFFAAYFFDKHTSLTLGYANLGSIAARKQQDGLYTSLQVGL